MTKRPAGFSEIQHYRQWIDPPSIQDSWQFTTAA
jgi:hypothetical protein